MQPGVKEPIEPIEERVTGPPLPLPCVRCAARTCRSAHTHSISMTKERMARVMAEKATDATSVGFIPPFCTHSHVLIPSPMDLPVHLVLVSLF